MKIKKEISIKKQGVCPNCGSKDVEYDGESETVDNSMFYQITCNKCKSISNEWYDIVYSETILFYKGIKK